MRIQARTTGLILLGFAFACVSGAYALAHSGRDTSPVAAEAAAGTSRGKLRLRVAHPTVSIAPGGVASFKVGIRQKVHIPPRDRRPVRLKVRDGVPSGATASFRRRKTRKSKSTLTIATGTAPSGSYRIRIRARSGERHAKSAVNLVIGSTPNPTVIGDSTDFAISGTLHGALIPGMSTPLDLTLTNPGPATRILRLGVDLYRVIAPRADATHPCTVDDFSVTQFSGKYGFALPSSSTRTLSQLGFPSGQWPVIAMLNRPVNQDGCQGASLDFRYSGVSTGSEQ
jgi:hypothetical protein